ncbi:N-acetylmuramoyl-L-alanine amidase [Rhodospirillaceae bacterium KN72]|uniref:N-acetylmuramoyl-L-alanine amidase n=1 Tax=Pacificispira spongiicola TaxID=2729598 RepID=A0A7Y0HEG8_9PROT|nr:N-acetylmuramoyl-L-alanine amidase [Pacificispira spongiicola]NMM44675.1 N-acetylmuramoyl-L-alanine amidase [Pacificispira spongiicola]
MTLPAVQDRPSPNHGPRRHGGPVDMLVLHYTGMASATAAIDRLCDPTAEVSAHYFVQEDGTILRLVAEAERAWHAGLAYWRGVTDVNSHSIGIEIQNPGHEFGYRAFPEKQIAAVTDLCLDILSRHSIPPSGIVGHSDIAPARKQDPGELFPWRQLAQEGVGVFPEAELDTDRSLSELLTEIGYDPDADLRINAFQRRFRPRRIDGKDDAQCRGLAARYLSLIQEKG